MPSNSRGKILSKKLNEIKVKNGIPEIKKFIEPLDFENTHRKINNEKKGNNRFGLVIISCKVEEKPRSNFLYKARVLKFGKRFIRPSAYLALLPGHVAS